MTNELTQCIIIFVAKAYDTLKLRKGLCPTAKVKEWGPDKMSQLKKVLITVPDSLLEAVDSAAKVENVNRSEFVREAMKMYLSERKKRARKEELKKGYQEMAELNLSLAEAFFEAEEEVFLASEKKLAECE